MKITIVGSLLLALCFFCLVTVLAPGYRVSAEEVYWEFKVPLILNKMPESIETVFLHWYIFDKNNQKLAEDFEEVPVDFENDDSFSTNVHIEVTDDDIDDPFKAYLCVIRLELSQDGMSSYPPNQYDKPWTQVEPGTELVQKVAVEKLQNVKPVNVSIDQY